ASLPATSPPRIYTLSLHDALPILREVVGADPLGAVAAADLAFAVGGAHRGLRLALHLVKPGAQHLQSARLVLVLRLLVLLDDDEIGRATSELQSPDHLVCRLLLEK